MVGHLEESKGIAKVALERLDKACPQSKHINDGRMNVVTFEYRL